MTEKPTDAPLPPLRDAIAEKAKVSPAAVDLVLSEIGVGEERPTRRADIGGAEPSLRPARRRRGSGG